MDGWMDGLLNTVCLAKFIDCPACISWIIYRDRAVTAVEFDISINFHKNEPLSRRTKGVWGEVASDRWRGWLREGMGVWRDVVLVWGAWSKCRGIQFIRNSKDTSLKVTCASFTRPEKSNLDRNRCERDEGNFENPRTKRNWRKLMFAQILKDSAVLCIFLTSVKCRGVYRQN